MDRNFLKWWPMLSAGALTLLVLAPVFSDTYWAVLPCIIAAGVIGYTAQVYWERNGKAVNSVLLCAISLGLLSYSSLLNDLWREDVEGAKSASLFLGTYFLVICGIAAEHLQKKPVIQNPE